MCVFMYSRTIAHVELMFLLIKPTLNKVYFTLLYFTYHNLVMPYDMIWVNFGSDNAGTKPLPEPMLTYHQEGSAAMISGQFHRKDSRSIQQYRFEYYINAPSPSNQ